MPEEKQSIVFEAKNVQAFIKDNKDAAKALQEQAKALDTSARSLRQQIIEAKKADQPNKQLIKSLMLEAQQAKLSASALKAQAAAIRDQGKEAANSAKVMNGAFSTVGGAIKGLLAPILAVGAAFAAGKILQTADNYKALQGRIQNATAATGDYVAVSKELSVISKDTGTQLEDTVDIFQRVAIGAKDLGKSNVDVLKLVKSVEQLGAISKASQTALQAGLLQFGQSLASGVVHAEEFNSIVENLPVLAHKIADGLGLSVGQLRAMVIQGKITSAQVFEALIKQTDEIQKEFEKLPVSMSRATNALTISLTEFIGAVDKATGGTGGLADVIAQASRIVDKFTNFINSNVSAIQDLISQVVHLAQAALDLMDAYNRLLLPFGDFLDLLKDMGLNLPSVRDLMIGFAESIDIVATKSQLAANEIQRMQDKVSNIRKAGFDLSKLDQLNAATDKQRNGVAAGIESGFLNRQGNRILGINGQSDIAGGVSRITTKPVKPFTKPKKAKKGKSLSTIEKEQAAEFVDQLSDFNSASSANQDYSKAFAAKINGGEITQAQDFGIQKVFLSDEAQKVAKIREGLQALKPKTAEGLKAQKEALEKLDDAITKNKTNVIKLDNEVTLYYKDLAEKQNAFISQLKEGNLAFEADQFLKNIEENKSEVDKLYEKGLISAQEYYEQISEYSKNSSDIQINAIDKQIELLDDQKAALTPVMIEQGKLLEIEQKRANLQNQRTTLVQGEAKAQRDIVRAKIEDLNKAAETFGNSLEQNIQTAITEAFSSDGPLKAMANFARNLKNQVVSFLAQGLAEGFKKSPIYQSITKFFGDLFNKLSGRSGAAGQAGGVTTPGLNISKGKLGLGLAGAALYAGGQFVAGGSNSALRGLGGVGLGAAGGALTGAAIGSIIPGIGTLIGAGIGGVVGGASTAAGNANKLGFFSTKKGQALAYALFGLGGLFTLGAGKKRRAAERAEYQQNTLQPYLDNLVSGADPNNLQDLIARRTAASRGKKANGSNGARAKQAAMAQIDELIKAREKSIADALKTLDKQNEELRDSIRLADAKPFEKAAIEREIALKQIEFDTKQLLDQFKDSQEAQTKILEQESLKRQQLQQQEQEAAKQDFEDLQDLLKQRDAVSNSNVFTRAQSAEQIKATQLASLDKQIAEAYQVIKGDLAAGITPKNIGDYQTLVGQANQLSNVQLSVVINESTDAQQTQEMINRAFDSFLRSAYGANGV